MQQNSPMQQNNKTTLQPRTDQMTPSNRPQQTMNGVSGSPSMNHGGHELFDVHEVLSGTINVLDQFMMFRQYVQDPELLDILDRQYQQILDGYNAMAETFTTGRAPSQSPAPYQGTQNNQVVYGVQPTQPKKPNQSLSDIKDQGISGHMLGLIKSAGSLLAMSSVEVTNPAMRYLMAHSVPCYIEMAHEIFLYQNKHRYYQVAQLTESDMQHMLTSYASATGQPTWPKAKMTLQ